MSDRINLNIVGEESLTKLSDTIYLNVTEKIENTFIINNSSQIIDFSFIDAPSIFVIEGAGFDLTIKDVDTSTMTFPVKGFFAMVLDPSNTIDELEVSTSLEVDTKVSIRIYNNIEEE